MYPTNPWIINVEFVVFGYNVTVNNLRVDKLLAYNLGFVRLPRKCQKPVELIS